MKHGYSKERQKYAYNIQNSKVVTGPLPKCVEFLKYELNSKQLFGFFFFFFLKRIISYYKR